MEIGTQTKIWKVATEAHPHYVYQLTGGKENFEAGDLITTSETDPPPDSTIFAVNEVFAGGLFSVNKPIPDATTKIVRKLGKVADLLPQEQLTAAQIRENEVREMLHQLYVNTPWTGTIQERLLDGYLYTITGDDMTLAKEERQSARTTGHRQVIVATGKAGVEAFVKAGKDRGQSEEVISKMIWLEMIIEGVRVYMNIKNLKITQPGDPKETIIEEGRESETDPAQEEGRTA